MSTKQRGFEKPPLGTLLKQILDFESPMALAYERGIGFEKDFHDHESHMLVCPRGPCRMTVQDLRDKKIYKIDNTKILWVPKGVEHNDQARSSIYDTLALFPNDEYFNSLIKDNGLVSTDRKSLETELVLFKKSSWLDEVLNRYFYERVLNRHSPPGCTFFLEKQILNEFVHIVFGEKKKSRKKETSSENFEEELGHIALRFIESNLFEDIDLEMIARTGKMSKSTLLRLFKSQLKTTPYEYIKKRRLDEALNLLKSKDYTIGDVAMLVGYSNFSAFSKAFRQRFGKTPTEFMSSNN